MRKNEETTRKFDLKMNTGNRPLCSPANLFRPSLGVTQGRGFSVGKRKMRLYGAASCDTMQEQKPD